MQLSCCTKAAVLLCCLVHINFAAYVVSGAQVGGDKTSADGSIAPSTDRRSGAQPGFRLGRRSTPSFRLGRRSSYDPSGWLPADNQFPTPGDYSDDDDDALSFIEFLFPVAGNRDFDDSTEWLWPVRDYEQVGKKAVGGFDGLVSSASPSLRLGKRATPTFRLGKRDREFRLGKRNPTFRLGGR